MDQPDTDRFPSLDYIPSFIGAIINGLLGVKIQKRMGKGAIAVIACAPVVIAFALSILAFFGSRRFLPRSGF